RERARDRPGDLAGGPGQQDLLVLEQGHGGTSTRSALSIKEWWGMDRLAWVCLGSALGGGARYLISLGALRWLGAGFPYGTLAVNVLGSFLTGLVMQVALTTTWISPNA